VEGGRERGTRQSHNEANIYKRQPSNDTCIGLVFETSATPGFVAHIKCTVSISGSVRGNRNW